MLLYTICIYVYIYPLELDTTTKCCWDEKSAKFEFTNEHPQTWLGFYFITNSFPLFHKSHTIFWDFQHVIRVTPRRCWGGYRFLQFIGEGDTCRDCQLVVRGGANRGWSSVPLKCKGTDKCERIVESAEKISQKTSIIRFADKVADAICFPYELREETVLGFPSQNSGRGDSRSFFEFQERKWTRSDLKSISW